MTRLLVTEKQYGERCPSKIWISPFDGKEEPIREVILNTDSFKRVRPRTAFSQQGYRGINDLSHENVIGLLSTIERSIRPISANHGVESLERKLLYALNDIYDSKVKRERREKLLEERRSFTSTETIYARKTAWDANENDEGNTEVVLAEAMKTLDSSNDGDSTVEKIHSPDSALLFERRKQDTHRDMIKSEAKEASDQCAQNTYRYITVNKSLKKLSLYPVTKVDVYDHSRVKHFADRRRACISAPGRSRKANYGIRDNVGNREFSLRPTITQFNAYNYAVDELYPLARLSNQIHKTSPNTNLVQSSQHEQNEETFAMYSANNLDSDIYSADTPFGENNSLIKKTNSQENNNNYQLVRECNSHKDMRQSEREQLSDFDDINLTSAHVKGNDTVGFETRYKSGDGKYENETLWSTEWKCVDQHESLSPDYSLDEDIVPIPEFESLKSLHIKEGVINHNQKTNAQPVESVANCKTTNKRDTSTKLYESNLINIEERDKTIVNIDEESQRIVNTHEKDKTLIYICDWDKTPINIEGKDNEKKKTLKSEASATLKIDELKRPKSSKVRPRSSKIRSTLSIEETQDIILSSNNGRPQSSTHRKKVDMKVPKIGSALPKRPKSSKTQNMSPSKLKPDKNLKERKKDNEKLRRLEEQEKEQKKKNEELLEREKILLEDKEKMEDSIKNEEIMKERKSIFDERKRKRMEEAERKRLEVERRREEKRRADLLLAQKNEELRNLSIEEEQKANALKAEVIRLEKERQLKEEEEKRLEQQRKIQRQAEEKRLIEEALVREKEEVQRLHEERLLREKLLRSAERKLEMLREEKEKQKLKQREDFLKIEEERRRLLQREQNRLNEEGKKKQEEIKRNEEEMRVAMVEIENRRMAAIKRRQVNLEHRKNLSASKRHQMVTRSPTFSYYVQVPRQVWELPIGWQKRTRYKAGGRNVKAT